MLNPLVSFSAILIIIWLIFLGLFIAGLVFWIFMIVDVAQRQFPNHDDRVLWILVVVLAGFIGAIVYYFVVKHKDQGHPTL
jgi:hypothetical protein